MKIDQWNRKKRLSEKSFLAEGEFEWQNYSIKLPEPLYQTGLFNVSNP